MTSIIVALRCIQLRLLVVAYCVISAQQQVKRIISIKIIIQTIILERGMAASDMRHFFLSFACYHFIFLLDIVIIITGIIMYWSICSVTSHSFILIETRTLGCLSLHTHFLSDGHSSVID